LIFTEKYHLILQELLKIIAVYASTFYPSSKLFKITQNLCNYLFFNSYSDFCHPFLKTTAYVPCWLGVCRQAKKKHLSGAFFVIILLSKA